MGMKDQSSGIGFALLTVGAIVGAAALPASSFRMSWRSRGLWVREPSLAVGPYP